MTVHKDFLDRVFAVEVVIHPRGIEISEASLKEAVNHPFDLFRVNRGGVRRVKRRQTHKAKTEFFHIAFLRRGQLMKLVKVFSSCVGLPTPFCAPLSIDFRSHAIFRASVRMVCKPSASLRTSSGVWPCT